MSRRSPARNGGEMAGTVIVMNHPDVPPDWIAEESSGAEFIEFSLDTAERVRAARRVVVLGGFQSATEPNPLLDTETEVLSALLARHGPVLGSVWDAICWPGQRVARYDEPRLSKHRFCPTSWASPSPVRC